MIRLSVALLTAGAMFAQAPPPQAAQTTQAAPVPTRLTGQQAAEMIGRSLQLMESTATVLPSLKGSSVSLVADARAAVEDLQRTPGNAAHTYHFMNDLRAYIQLADLLPQPADMPQEGVRQLTELRANVNLLESYFRQLLITKETQLRNPDRDNLRRYAAANQSMQAATPGRVVFFGDSITDGWRLNEYFPGKDFVNRGISGQVTGEMLGRMQADVINLKPRAMILLAGTNDLARGTDVRTVENNIMMIAELAKTNNIKLLLCSILPVSDYHKSENPRFEMTKVRDPAKIREVNSWMQSLCKSAWCNYVDYFSAMVDSAGMLQSDLADDGLHPNAKGYRIMAPIAQKSIEEVIHPAAPTAAPPPAEKKRNLNPFSKQ